MADEQPVALVNRVDSGTMLVHGQKLRLDEDMRFQSGTSNWGGRRYLPYAFTEQGVPMFSSVLHNARAIHVGVEIMCGFVRLLQVLASNAGLSRRLSTLDKKFDAQFKAVFDAVRELMTALEPKNKRAIAYIADIEAGER